MAKNIIERSHNPSKTDAAGNGPAITVVVVDFSLFSAEYDAAFCNHLATSQYDVSLICRPLRETETLNLHERVKVKTLFYNHSESFRSASLSNVIKPFEHAIGWLKLAAFIMRVRPQVVHFQWLPIPAFDVVFIKLCRAFSNTVLTVHNSAPYHNGDVPFGQKLLWRFSHKATDALFYHTRHTEKFVKSVKREGQRTIRGGHGLIDCPDARLVEKGKTKNGRLKVLFFGAIKPYKGIETFLESLSHTPPIYLRHIDFLILGNCTGQYREVIKDLVSALPSKGLNIKLRLESFSESTIVNELRSAHYSIFAHTNIDASGALIKSLSYASVPIVSNAGGFPEFVEDGCDGFIFPVNNPRSLSRIWQRISDGDIELYRQLASCQLKRSSRELSWGVCTKGLLKYYGEASGVFE